MRVGILTFHRAYNNGAFLQCYSLQKEIKRRHPDWDVEIIDYLSGNMARYYQTNFRNYLFGAYNTLNNHTLASYAKNMAVRCYSIVRGDSGIKRYYSTDSVAPLFEKSLAYLPLSSVRLVSDDYDETIRFIDSLAYDIIVVGSDAVWNDYQTNIPNVFYLNPAVKARKLSYAASCYGFEYKAESKEAKKAVGDCLSDFLYIGVRDNETEQYVRDVCPDTLIHHNCDPTLLLDINDIPVNISDLEKKLSGMGIDLSKPVIGVMGNSDVGKKARNACGSDAQLVGLFYENPYCDYSLVSLSPFEWAVVFRFMTVTFTSFFHGTIFSLKNGVPTVTLEQNLKFSENYMTKTKDLLQRLSLEDYYFAPDIQIDEKIKDKYFWFLENNQRDRIFSSIQKERCEAESFFDFLNNLQ